MPLRHGSPTKQTRLFSDFRPASFTQGHQIRSLTQFHLVCSIFQVAEEHVRHTQSYEDEVDAVRAVHAVGEEEH